MLPMLARIWSRRSALRVKRVSKSSRRVRLNVELLEDRLTPTANFSGTVSGFVSIVPPSSQALVSTSGAFLPGVDVSLDGITNQGTVVNVIATADGNGAFNFLNVLPGSYHVSAGSIPGLQESGISIGSASSGPGPAIGPTFTMGAGQTITQNVDVAGGIDPSRISMLMFLTTTSQTSFPLAPAGSGQGLANYRPDSAPVVSNAIAAQSVSVNSAATMIDLAGHFTDPDITNSEVTFNITNGGSPESLNVTLFDTTAPQTVANFLDYVKSGDYNNALFTRLVSGFVLQGGGLKLDSAQTGLNATPVLPAVPNEFGASNTADTLAMALSSGNINSGTNQFFFNLVSNASSLDAQKFTVFGQLTDIQSELTLSQLATTTVKNESSSSAAAANPSVDLSDIPLTNYTGTNFPTDAAAGNYMLINSITIDKQDEFLTYSATSSNPGLVTASVNNEWLTLNYAPGKTGSSSITVTATDRYGATVNQTFNVTIAPSAPVVNSVSIGVDNAATPTTLTATPVGSDPQNLPITYTYKWFQNGTAIAGATSQSLSLSPLTIATGDKFTVAVTPSDSALTGTAVTSSPITVASGSPLSFQAPVISSVTISPDNTSDASSLTANVSSSDPATFTYQWLHNGTAISNATGAKLVFTGLTIASGDTFSVEVTPAEGALTGTAVTSGAVKVASTNPIVIDVPVVNSIVIAPDNATSTTTLTATPTSTDPQGNPVTYTYQWYQNNQAISGATSQTLSLSSLTVSANDQFAVGVTPNNGVINGQTAISDATTVATVSPITLSPPTVSSVTISSNSTSDATQMTAVVSSPSPASIAYQWLQNGTAITGANSATLLLSGLTIAKNDTFTVRATPAQGPLSGAAVTSNTITVTGINPTTTTA